MKQLRLFKTMLLMCLLLSGISNARGESYTIVFGNNANGAVALTSTVGASTVITSGTDYVTNKPFTVNSGNCYYGDTKTTIRIGKSGAEASLSIALSDAGKVYASSIVVRALNMGGDKNASATLSANNATPQTTSSQEELDYTFTVNDFIEDITLSTSAAVKIYMITVNIGTAPTTPYTVTFEAGANGTCSTSSLTEASAGAGITLPSVIANTGYNFKGWSASSNPLSADAGVAGDTYKPSEDCTLYAYYRQTHTAKFYVNGTQLGDTQTIEEGTEIAFPEKPVGENGYTFVGWTTQENYNNATVEPSDLCSYATMGDKDVSFYAVFAKLSENGEKGNYKLVESALDDWSGDYLVVYNNMYAMNTHSGNQNANTFATYTDISSSYIAGDKSIQSNDITNNLVYRAGKTANGYSLYCVSDDSYLGITSGTTTTGAKLRWNTSYSESECDWNLGVGSIGNVGSSTLYIRWNNNSGSERFAAYTQTGQKAIQLYKREIISIYTDYTTKIKTLSKIEVKTPPSKVVYVTGDCFDPSGLGITATYSDESSEEILYSSGDSNFSFEPSLTTPLQTTNGIVTISYKGISTTQEITVNENPGLGTIEEIFAAATSAGSTATEVKIVFGNWVVSGVSFDKTTAYVTDGTKGFIIYAYNHGFEVGDILSGTAQCKVQLYNGSAELTALTSTTEGLTVTKGGTVNEQTMSITGLSGINTGALLTYENLTYHLNGDKAEFSDGENILIAYDGLLDKLPNLFEGRSYNIKGVFQLFGTQKELLPRSIEDIILIGDVPTHKIKWSVNGSIIKEETVVENEAVSAPVFEVPNYTEKVFTGWVTNPSVDYDEAPKYVHPRKSKEDITYYAVFATQQGVAHNATEVFTNSEIGGLSATSALAYTNETTYQDGDIDYTIYAYTDQVNRKWLQQKRDEGVYIKMKAPSAIKNVSVTITSTKNSTSGINDIAKHSPFEGTVALTEEDCTYYTSSESVASTNAITDNVATLVPDSDNDELFLKVSTGARIWNMSVTYVAGVTYSEFTTILRLVLDEEATEIPEAKEVHGHCDKVIVKRAISGGKWATLCLPFNMNSSQIASKFPGAKIEKLEGLKVSGNTYTMFFAPVDEILSGKPYLIKLPVSTEYNGEIELENVDVEYYKGDFVDYVSTLDGSSEVIYRGSFIEEFLSPNTNNYSLSSNDILYVETDDWSNYGFRGYFEISNTNSKKALVHLHDEDISKIAVTSPPSKLEYTEGENFDPSGLVVSATYSYVIPRGTYSLTYTFPYADYASKFSFAPSLTTALKPTDTQVTITFGGASVDLPITVNAAPRYSATFSVNGLINEDVATYLKGALIEFPNADDILPIGDYVFVGWSKVEINEKLAMRPTIVDTSNEIMQDNDVTYYAVYAEANGDGPAVYSKKTSLSEGDKIILALESNGQPSEGVTGVASTGATLSNTSEDWMVFTATKYLENLTENDLCLKNDNNLYIRGGKGRFEFTEDNPSAITVDANSYVWAYGNWVLAKNESFVRFYSEQSFEKLLMWNIEGGISYTNYTTFVGHIREGLSNGKLGTICVPHAVKVKATKGADFYSIDHKRKNDNGVAVALVLNEIEEESVLEPGIPYIFRAQGQLLMVPYLSQHVEVASQCNGLFGTFDRLPFSNFTEEYMSDVYVITSNKVQKANSDSGVVANRAYIKMNAVPDIGTSGAKQVVLGFDGDITSGVINISGSDSVSDNHYYNIAGQRVNANHKGIIIVNGRKYINK